jgi:hypothetical protein
MPEETKVPADVDSEEVENGPASSPSPSKKKPVNKGKLVLARVALLDGSLLDVNIEVRGIMCNWLEETNFSCFFFYIFRSLHERWLCSSFYIL